MWLRDTMAAMAATPEASAHMAPRRALPPFTGHLPGLDAAQGAAP